MSRRLANAALVLPFWLIASFPFLCLFSFLGPLVLDFGGFLISADAVTAGPLDTPAAALESPVGTALAS